MTYVKELNDSFQLIDFSNYPDNLPDMDAWMDAMQKIFQKMPIGYEFEDTSGEYYYEKIADDTIEVNNEFMPMRCSISYSSRDIYNFLTAGLEVHWEEAESKKEIPNKDTWKEYIASFVEA